MAKYKLPRELERQGWPTPASHLGRYLTISVERCMLLAYANKGDELAVEWWWEAAAIAKRVYDE